MIGTTILKNPAGEKDERRVLRFGNRHTRLSRSFDIGKTWSGEGLTIGRSAACEVREISFTASTDVIVFLKGGYEGILAIDSDKPKRYLIEQNDLLWLPKGTQYYSLMPKAKSVVYVNLDPAIRQRFHMSMPNMPTMDEAIAPIRNVERQQIFSALLSDFIDSDGLGGRLRAEALINLACMDIYEHLGSSGANERTAILPTWVLDRVTEYIECNLENDVSLAVLAEIAGLSEFHFLRMFTASTGKTPYQFVLTRRFVRARDLLVNSDESIAQIAYQVGFSSQSHLTSMFKKMTGVTPGKFRREN